MMILLLIFFTVAFGATSDRQHTCTAGAHHKSVPSPEADIQPTTSCGQYSGLSCCTAATAHSIDQQGDRDLYNFHWDDCGDVPHDCQKYLKAESCFFECDPYLGPWKGQWEGSLSGVPICASYCDDWFEACKNVPLCAANWIDDFVENVTTGRYHCTNQTCHTFATLYGNGKGLCETMWGSSFRYASDTTDCMVMMFDGENPNANVMKHTCTNGDFHKDFPSPELGIQQSTSCGEYSQLSCCTESTAHSIDQQGDRDLYSFHWDDCGDVPHDCQKYLKAESCFFECDPYLGPWKGQWEGSLSGVPICASYCDDWFEACKNVPLCAANWIDDFVENVTTGRYHCTNQTCHTFATLYGNGKGLCETMWGASFLYDDDNTNCMVMMFNGENPNEKVIKDSGTSGFLPIGPSVSVIVVTSILCAIVQH